MVLMEFFEESVLIFSNFLKIQDNTGQILQIQDKFGNTGQFLKIQDIQYIQDTLDSLIRRLSTYKQKQIRARVEIYFAYTAYKYT